MHLDDLVLPAGVIVAIWCATSCVLGLLIARSIRLADLHDTPSGYDNGGTVAHPGVGDGVPRTDR